jgi:hypothetical protein
MTRKLNSICQQFNLEQIFSEPTNYIESSSSILDLFLVSSSQNVFKSGIGEPVLDQHIRFHCPIYAFFKFSKPCVKSFKRHIWLYDKGDYNLLRD